MWKLKNFTNNAPNIKFLQYTLNFPILTPPVSISIWPELGSFTAAPSKTTMNTKKAENKGAHFHNAANTDLPKTHGKLQTAEISNHIGDTPAAPRGLQWWCPQENGDTGSFQSCTWGQGIHTESQNGLGWKGP